MIQTHRIHGITFASAHQLQAPIVDDLADVVFSSPAQMTVPTEPSAGEVIASLDDPGFILTRTPEGYTYRIYGYAEFTLSPDLRSIDAHIDPRRPHDIFTVLASGTIAAAVAALRGACVLHASGISHDGITTAFVGGSGAGKSTLAALLMADGGVLIGDDALALESRGQEIWSHSGTDSVRLRPTASSLSGWFDPQALSRSADDRLIISSREVAPPMTRIDAVAFPIPARDVDRVGVERLGASEALMELSRFPRLLGLTDQDIKAERFRVLAAVARGVPVLRVTVPWGPPFARDLAEQITSAIGERV